MNKLKRKVIAILTMLSVVVGNMCVPGNGTSEVFAQEVKENELPVISGTSRIEVLKDTDFDVNSVLNRVYATDYEDGDLTQDIEITSTNVDTARTGSYAVNYKVEDSAGGETQMSTIVQVVDSYSSVEGQAIQKKLYTKESAEHLLAVELYRGYYHDRQHLGIYLNKNATLKIRIANWEEYWNYLTLDLFADDSSIEKSYSIPWNGEWLTISPEDVSEDMVPFIRTPQSGVQPIVEYYYTSDNMEKLTYYNYGDEQKAFFDVWNGNEQQYAVVEGERVTMLIPRIDKDIILNNGSTIDAYRFTTIDAMLEYYKNMQEQYDEYVGLSYVPENPVDKNIRARYFVKADASGVGAAYYSAYSHIAENSKSISGFLKKDWMSLHEIAHGYDTSIASGDIPLVETINNILGHYYERDMLIDGDHGWSGLQDIASSEAVYINQLKSGITFEDMEFDARLYCMLNLLNKTDAKEMMSALHHAWRMEETKTSTIDFIVENFSRTSGYNLIPYFEEYGIYAGELTKSKIYEAGYPILEHFADCFANEEAATAAKRGSDIEVTGLYSLVTPAELVELNKTGTIQIDLNIDDINQLMQKDVRIMNGVEEVAVGKITSGVLVFENVPVGSYHIELPAAKDRGYYSEYVNVIVKNDVITNIEGNYYKAGDNMLKDDVEILLNGLSDATFAIVSTNVDEEKVIVETKISQPHYIFNDAYATVKVLSESGRVLYSRDYIGSEVYEAQIEEIVAPIGSIVEITHQELYHSDSGSRVKAYSQVSGLCCDEFTNDVVEGNNIIRMVVTENGLQREDWTKQEFESVRSNLYKKYAELVDSVMSEEQKNDSSAYQMLKAELLAAVYSLSAESQVYFEETYPYLFYEKMFDDVYEVDYYYEPVRWAVKNGITDGWTEVLFAPNMACTRGQVVTFLWRAAGQPEAETKKCPFTDVAENAYYYEAVLWAVENGITDGWTEVQFAPDMECTRGQIVTFIWRAAGQPKAKTVTCAFEDVAENAYYYEAVLWAVENGITDGWTDVQFAPDMECTRGQIVTFLYRAR